uniref:Peptidase S53 domain-containing protein n=1 Tax=Arcella intermedia TaxID=1963864 RepID=A0A6B2L1F0_9EUKA
MDILEDLFWKVSEPGTLFYGKHLSQQEVQDLVRPSPVAIQTLLEWVDTFEVTQVELLNDFLLVRGPASVLEEMLHCQFHHFQHTSTGKTIIRARGEYSLPAHVAAHVDFVGGVKHFPVLRSRSLGSRKRSPLQDLQVTPRLLKERYNINSAVGQAKNNSQSVAQFLEQYFSAADLEEFFTLFLQTAIGTVPTTVGPNDFGAGVEASLDIEYIMSTGQGIPTVFWSTGGLHDNQEPFLKWMVTVENTTNAPLLFSVSYGDDEPSLTLDYVTRVNVEFKKQGVRGISLLFASGDDGVGGDDSGCSRFVPGYPATSPYVTAVGGTTLEGWLETGKEIVNGLSGGGFSDYFVRPSYQDSAVKGYLSKMSSQLPPANLWNNTGRGFPDLAALSSNYVVVVNFVPLPGVAGTSCASPAISGIIGLLNDSRLLAGKSSLGFLNPLLYKLAVEQPQVFFDIVDGSNPGCGTDGFSATQGWDPATGLIYNGSPVEYRIYGNLHYHSRIYLLLLWL